MKNILLKTILSLGFLTTNQLSASWLFTDDNKDTKEVGIKEYENLIKVPTDYVMYKDGKSGVLVYIEGIGVYKEIVIILREEDGVLTNSLKQGTILTSPAGTVVLSPSKK